MTSPANPLLLSSGNNTPSPLVGEGWGEGYTDAHWMQHALKLAQQAKTQGEVPIGAVLVLDNKMIGEGFNQVIGLSDPSAHAEILALRSGAKHLNNYRLLNTILYVTLEPCPMCMSAMVHARIQRLVFGARQFFDTSISNHKVEITPEILAEPCSQILKSFFQNKR